MHYHALRVTDEPLKSYVCRLSLPLSQIGDEYVAATGLPERRDDHYLVMIKFARDCMFKMTEIVRDLEESLGPGTQNLRMRFGIHSGAVTAGVLRGEKSRFQLFGDTGMQEIFATHCHYPILFQNFTGSQYMLTLTLLPPHSLSPTVNTASRMESTGIPNKIQVSSTTANLLAASGKEHWIKKRHDSVKAKGKGLLQTFWIDTVY